MIPVFHPKASVTLTKVVRRTGPSRLNREIRDIDLTGWLGELGGIVVHRALNSPVAVTITLADRMSGVNEDTLYSLIEPQDTITVRMARMPHKYRHLPVSARIFVDSVKRTETMGGDGKPVRAIVIQGSDIASKALQIVEIFHKLNYKLGNALLAQFPLFELGVKFDQMTAGSFVSEVVAIGNKWLASLSQKAAFYAVPLKINVDTSLVTKGKVGPYSIQPYQGNLWTFLQNWCDLAWNELILQDREDGPWLVYRPKPYRGLDGKPTSLDPAMQKFRPEEIELDDSQVVKMDVERSDADVANYFNVRAPQAEMLTRELLDPYYLQHGSIFVEDQYPNAAYSIYGLKKLEAISGQLADEYLQHPDGLNPADKQEIGKFMGDWITWRRDELLRQNIDDALWEVGTMTVQGWETILPGVNIMLTRGALRASYYVDSVTHDFRPFSTYLCNVNVKRGTGFVERSKLEGSPYFAEGRKGAYG